MHPPFHIHKFELSSIPKSVIFCKKWILFLFYFIFFGINNIFNVYSIQLHHRVHLNDKLSKINKKEKKTFIYMGDMRG